jgi:hypothetical protein
VAAGAAVVARIEPTMTKGNPSKIPAESGSPRTATPSATATAGLTYAITVARAGPTSATRPKKARKATAVQISPRVATDHNAAGDTGEVGSENGTNGT